MKLDENHLQNYLIKEINQNRIKFIPNEAIIELSKLILEKNIKMILKQDKEKFKQQIIEKFSNQICTKSSQYFKQLVKTVDPKNTNLKNVLIGLLEKTREFFYVNICTDFWNNPQIERAYKVMSLECKNDFNFLISKNNYLTHHKNKIKSIDEKIMDDFYVFIKENPLLSDEEYGKYVYNYYFQNLQKCNTVDMSSLAEKTRRTSVKYLPVHIQISIDFKSFSDANLSPPDQCKTFFIFPTTNCNELFELAKKEFKLQSIPFYIKYDQDRIEMLNDSTCLYQLNSYDYKIFYGVFVESTKSILESLVNPKIIKISDDFCIETNNQKAEYTVNFPKNHDGWLNVAFDIEKKDKSTKNNKDNLVIFLQLNEKESSYLLEGNSIELQYYQGNKWVTQKDDVFLSFPKCDSAVFPLHHCSKYKLSKQEIKIQKNEIRKGINDNYINDKYSRNWNYFDPNKAYVKGGQPYYLPVGFESYGIKREYWDKNTCVAFYGTVLKEINGIIEKGFELPSETNGDTKFGVENYENAIFVSPSIKYALLKRINETVILKKDKIYISAGCTVKDEDTSDYCYRLLFSYRPFPNTENFFANDPHFPENIIEWRIPNPNDVYPYRILYKFIRQDEFLSNYIEKIRDQEKKIKILSSKEISKLLKRKENIGSGGSSTVYKVKNIINKDQKYLALKILNSNLISKDKKIRKTIFMEEETDDDSDYEEESESEIDDLEQLYDKEKFNLILKEALMINSLNHKNIVKIYGYFNGNKHINPAILLEFCSKNLPDCIHNLEDKYCITAIFEICSVMTYLHAQKIIYRDLKPENVLLKKNNHVKLCDFGICKDTDNKKYTSLTNHFGAPVFIAPEMYEHNFKYNEKVDVYAFGVLMYFILTKGQYPDSKDLEKVKIPSSINKLSQKIIKSCWLSVPQKRPSFSEIIKMIVDNYYLLIDGIESQVPDIIKFLREDGHKILNSKVKIQ